MREYYRLTQYNNLDYAYDVLEKVSDRTSSIAFTNVEGLEEEIAAAGCSQNLYQDIERCVYDIVALLELE